MAFKSAECPRGCLACGRWVTEGLFQRGLWGGWGLARKQAAPEHHLPWGGVLAARLFPRLSLSVVRGLGRCRDALADGSEERLLGKETRWRARSHRLRTFSVQLQCLWGGGGGQSHGYTDTQIDLVLLRRAGSRLHNVPGRCIGGKGEHGQNHWDLVRGP